MDSSAARAMCAIVEPRVRPTMAPRASGCQYGAPRPVKAGTNMTPPLSGTLSAELLHLAARLDRVQAIAQPLHDGAADEDAAFARELRRPGGLEPRAW